VSKLLYLIRHGQSQANQQGRVQGWLDSPLSNQGREQVHRLAQRLSTEANFCAVFSSPLQRAAETAHLIAAHTNCPPKFDAGLREYNMGPITGLTMAEIKAQFPARHAAFERNEPLPPLPGAESEDAFMARVQNCLHRITQQVPNGQTAVVVTHGGTLNACLRYWLGLNGLHRPFRFANASITMVEIAPGGVRILCLNDTCHLQSGPTKIPDTPATKTRLFEEPTE
jgi:broad specificity phosphatase PhoE